MKTNVKLLIAIALMATACTTGSKVTSGGYSDDLYFTPGDAQPVAPRPRVEKEVKQPQQKSMVAMQVEENKEGKIVNNYVVPKSSRKDNNAYYFDDQPAYSDTTLEYKDDKEQVTINNYFDGEEMDYTTRIRTFYNPYFYDPFWDPFWSPFYGPSYSFGWGFGGGFYPGWGGGWYNPWYSGYYGYGFSYGWGGGWYDPWYSGYYGYGYGWGGGYYPLFAGGNWDSGNRHYGIQNYTGRRGGSNAVKYGMNTGGLSGSSYNRTLIGRNSASSTTRSIVGNNLKDAVVGTRSASGNVGSTNTRSSGTLGTRAITTPQQVQGSNTTQGTRAVRGETISNLRRSNNNNIQGRAIINQNGSPTRSSSTGSEYTPTYSRPRMNTQPSYNNGSTRQYTSPQSTYGNSSTNRYARPSSGSVGSSSVRTQSSGSYQRGSVSSSPTRSTDGASYNSRSYSPSSVPSRSYSAPASSSGGSRSIGGGGGGGSSSGGSGGSSGGSGGSSGRTR